LDCDGDLGFLFNPEDPLGIKTYTHLMSSTPSMRIKQELFHVGDTIFSKGKQTTDITLQNVLWNDYAEEKMLHELKAKGLIGQCWYILQHYNFLYSHPSESFNNIQTGDLGKYLSRLETIRSYASQYPDSSVAEVYNKLDLEFERAGGWTFFMFSESMWKKWIHLCYVAMSHAFFQVYELIFDSRKGEQNLKFNLSDMLQALSGSKDAPYWEGMREADIWIDPIKDVYESLPVTGDRKNLRAAITPFPIYEATVTKRRKFTLEELEKLIVANDQQSFTKYMLNGFFM
jgi:hypothetical protein